MRQIPFITNFAVKEQNGFVTRKTVNAGAATGAIVGRGKDIKLEEETLIRFNKYGKVNDEKFRIDMTEIIKIMMSIESKFEKRKTEYEV